MKRKPRLTIAEARMLCEVDAYIRKNRIHSNILDHAFSDTHDGNLFRREVEGLIRKRLLWVAPIPVRERPGPPWYDNRLLGYSCSVGLTDRAMRIFWPDLYAQRQADSASPTGGMRDDTRNCR